MHEYTHILVALDLTHESHQVLKRAAAFAQANNARISLVHVIEPLGYAYGGDIPMDLTQVQEQLEANARKHMLKIGSDAGIGENALHILVGRPDSEIHRFADEQHASLIVVGSHGRHGLQLLLGSTANSILHGAKCDVLAVRIQDGTKTSG
jgi:universal stress protein A